MQRPTRSPTLSGSFASLPLQALNDGIQNQTAAWFRLDVGIRGSPCFQQPRPNYKVADL